METNCAYRILEGKVAHEIIDGEAIVIQFDTGNYYSLNGVAAEIWPWIVAGADRAEMLAAFAGVTPEQAAAFDAFFDGLARESILEKVPAGARAAGAPVVPRGGRAFAAPAFEKYDDMQNLLLSDPIHEVDATGWPRQQTDAA